VEESKVNLKRLKNPRRPKSPAKGNSSQNPAVTGTASPMTKIKTGWRYNFVGWPETPIVFSTSPRIISIPSERAISAWKMHREAPVSIIASKGQEGGECLTGFDMRTFSAAYQSACPFSSG
jgi:hypothetical protein